MRCMKAKVAYKGVALGKIHVLQKEEHIIKRTKVEDVEAEIQRVHDARECASEQLRVLYGKALKEVGESSAAVFEVHQMMLEDEDYIESIENIIRTQQVNGEYAVAITGDNFSEMFASMDDEYMQARSIDVKDVSERVVRCLFGGNEEHQEFEEPVIIVADDLTPSETVTMDKNKILAFVTVHGSVNSHTAILARTMNIPALVGAEIDLTEIHSGMEALVDCIQGEFILEPSKEMKQKAEALIAKEEEKQQLLHQLKGKENVTLSGKKIKLYANIGSVGDVGYALENDAGGIGLFRSEFLYIGKEQLPDEQEQFQVYKQVAQNMAGKKVIIRTMDIGADKQADYLQLGKEENPALGYRAIRICLSQTDVFKTQLRALYRAAIYGNISIMYPMIISTEEVEKIKQISAEVKKELKEQGIPYKDVEEGIMIETPAAVMISDELAKMVDFFSIGTNDLTQYTLAIDRQNEKLDAFYNPHHKAILKMIQIAADNAHKEGKWIGICGELGADPSLTKTFLDMGIDELSVAPSSILKLRKIIRELE